MLTTSCMLIVDRLGGRRRGWVAEGVLSSQDETLHLSAAECTDGACQPRRGDQLHVASKAQPMNRNYENTKSPARAADSLTVYYHDTRKA